MIQTKSLFSYGVTAAVVMTVVAVTTLSIDTAMNAYAQNMTTPPAAQQTKSNSGSRTDKELSNASYAGTRQW